MYNLQVHVCVSSMEDSITNLPDEHLWTLENLHIVYQ